MTYLLQVSTCWIVFFGIYLLFLRKETFFNINRYYLLGALVTGLIVPYLGGFIPANGASVEVYQVMTQFSGVEVSPQAYIEQATPIITWANLLWAVYILGGLVVFSRFLFGLNRIYNIYKTADISPKTNYTLVESEKYHLPFSFFHFIFISKQLPLNDEVEKVLRHEELHANQWHSVDIVFIELLQVFFWFNPILILYKSALRQSHEYLADAYVTQNHNKNSYGRLLLQQSTSGLEIALANQFFHSQIKKRITMMYKEKSKRSAMVKYLAAVPVLVAMLLIFSSNQVEVLNTEDSLMESQEIYSSLENEINEKNTPPYIRFGYERGSTDPLVLINDEIVNQVNYPKTDYKCESMIHYYQDEAIEKFGEKGKFGAVNFKGLKFVKSEDSEIGNFDGRKITQRNWKALFNKYRNLKGQITISAEANADGDVIYAEGIKEKTTIDNREILKDALRASKDYKIEKGNKNSTGEIVFNFSREVPLQGYTYREDIDVFNFDSEINLGEQVPEGSVLVKTDGRILEEHIDYKIDYTKGKLIMLGSYDNKLPVNVTFKETQVDPIFKVVEEMPRFPGCEDMDGTTNEKENCAKQMMLEFVYSNLKYPAKARDAGVEGMCVVQFVVEKDGSVAEAKLVRDIGAGCGVETMKVVNNFPTWIPGKQRGKAVRVQYMLPVKFKLEDSSKEEKTKIDETVHIVGFGESNLKKKKENLIINTNSELPDDIFKVVQEMPRFSGCEDMEETAKEKEDCAKQKMLEYVYRNIKYPKEARAKGIDGMSVIRMVIEKDGSVTNVSTLRDPGAGTGAEAARMVREMPTWIPGKQNGKEVRVQYILPVKFKLEGDNKSSNIKDLLEGKTSGISVTENDERQIRLKTSNYNGPDPLFVIDGTIKENASVESLNPDDIESINVLKGEKAIDKYGEDGVYGAVEITTKSDKQTTNNFIKAKSNKLNPIKFSASPNPSDGNFNVIYQLEKNIPANLTFYSIDGTTIKRMLNLPAENNINVDLSNHNLPLIYITLEQDGKTKTIKATFQ